MTADDVLDVAQRYLDPAALVILVVGNLEATLAGDPERPEFSLEEMRSGEVVRIPLPDPFTMEYPLVDAALRKDPGAGRQASRTTPERLRPFLYSLFDHAAATSVTSSILRLSRCRSAEDV